MPHYGFGVDEDSACPTCGVMPTRYDSASGRHVEVLVEVEVATEIDGFPSVAKEMQPQVVWQPNATVWFRVCECDRRRVRESAKRTYQMLATSWAEHARVIDAEYQKPEHSTDPSQKRDYTVLGVALGNARSKVFSMKEFSEMFGFELSQNVKVWAKSYMKGVAL